MISKIFRYTFFTLFVVSAQVLFLPYIAIANIVPDIVAIWVVYLALKEGQLAGTFWGFFAGLSIDLITGNFIGLSALTKTIGGFSAGYFFEEEKLKITLGSYRFMLVVFISSFFQHFVYFIVFTRGSEIDIVAAIIDYGVTTTLYTTLISLFPVLITARRASTVHVE